MSAWGEPRSVAVAEGVSLCVQTCGDADDPPVLLVSGQTASMDWWDDGFCEALAAGGRYVVRFDHRDTGASTTWQPGSPAYTAMDLDDDVWRLVDAFGLGPVHLVGLSMGGGIGQYLALHQPRALRTLTAMSTTAIGGVEADLPGPAPGVMDEVPDPDWADREAYADWLVRGLRVTSGTLPFDESRARATALRLWDRAASPASALNHTALPPGDEPEGPDDVGRIDVPTLVVHGSADPLFPLPHGEALAAAIPGARLLVLDGVGHEVPPPSTWDVVVPAILEHTA